MSELSKANKLEGGTVMSNNPCLYCDCNDPDMGCSMPSIDKWYACPLEAGELTELDFMSMDELIEIISRQNKLLDFLDSYHLLGLREATAEQLKEYIKEELNNDKYNGRNL